MCASAAAKGSTRRIIPGPPPYGVSSTERCFPGAKSRGFVRSTAISPEVTARPSRLAERKPANSSGNRVTTSKVISGPGGGEAPSLMAVTLARDLLVALPGHDHLPRHHVDGAPDLGAGPDQALALSPYQQ